MVIPIALSPADARIEPAESQLIRRRVAFLPSLCRDIQSCVVDLGRQGGRIGERTRHQVHVEVTLPGVQIGVIEPSATDRCAALSAAFDAVTQRLREYVRQHPTHAALDDPG